MATRKRISVLLSDDERLALEALAENERRSLSQMLGVLILREAARTGAKTDLSKEQSKTQKNTPHCRQPRKRRRAA